VCECVQVRRACNRHATQQDNNKTHLASRVRAAARFFELQWSSEVQLQEKKVSQQRKQAREGKQQRKGTYLARGKSSRQQAQQLVPLVPKLAKKPVSEP
jgi:hypothetical protein